MTATVLDPVTEPAPPEWDRFARDHRLWPGWHSGPMRATDLCISTPSRMVLVADGDAPVGLFHTRHLGPANLARFAPAGRMPPVSIAECRTAPVPQEAGLAFAAATDQRDRVEAVRVFEQELRRRTGPGGIGMVYRYLLSEHLPAVPAGGRSLRRISSRMVVSNQWPDLPSYLASLPAKWRSQLKKLHHEITTDPELTVELVDTIDPAQACWLHDVVRRRYAPRLPPSPPFPELLIAELNQMPGFRFLTYRDRRHGLVGYSAVYDNGADLVLIWWGSRGPGDGWRANLYFDQYLRLVELMISLGRPRLVLGAGMEHIKARYGARPEPRFALIGVPVSRGPTRPAAGGPPAAAGQRRTGAGPDAARPDAAGPSAHSGLLRLSQWVAGSLSPRPARAEKAPTCPQCGEHAPVRVLRRRVRRPSCWCQRCGAVVADRPAGAATPAAGPAAAPAATGPATDPQLASFLPPAMVRWASQRARSPLRADRLDKATAYQLYRAWDGHLRRLGVAGAAALAGPGEPPPCPGLPPFSQVVGAVQDSCYHTEAALAALRQAAEPVPEAALRERVEHARRWLAGPGRSLCWIESRVPAAGPANPDPAAAKAALAALRAGAAPDPDAAHAARAALFGTEGGPALATLRRTYPAERMVVALEAYLASGARPLREETLARLTPPDRT